MTNKQQTTNHSENRRGYLYPRYWGHWLLLGVLRLLTLLPHHLRLRVGGWLGRGVLGLLKYRREISAINIAKAFPEYSEQERKALLKSFSENMGRGVIESAMAWFSSDEQLEKRTTFSADPDSLALINNPDVPVILVGIHSTMLELGLRLLGLHIDAAGMYKPLHDDFFNYWLKEHRASSATDMVHYQDMRLTLKLLKNGGNIWYALDQDMGPRVSVYAPFFGINTASVNILPKLRERSGAHWIPVFMWREDDGNYSVRVAEEIKPQDNDTDEAVMTRVNAAYEQEIRRYPAQYYWLHRRFKHTADGAPHEYPKR
ncbi:lysophospholipid acyltransferase family protein [Suttonella sp. R2A3]|uniref:lysophospholipid acyltransferase family protein n=1 Tax=Suttonella sp. R2A3 TaxID=2908648 RepID=UPI001F435097|nr:lysophospholipid acyltransferase family protein [Suttonella sp. R2A3]UJF24886.1 lysophospholipid acyltransferase family protein [Suttonella sp. R2A3]